MSKPIIAIPGAQTDVGSSVSVMADYTNHAYCAGVEKAGGIPILLPIPQHLEDLDPVLETCQGILLPGGIDVDPRFYNEDPLPVLGTINAEMDRFWIHVTMYAVQKKLPLLGICRGLQLANVALGGSLYQDLSMKNPSHMLHSQKQNRDYLMHLVTIEEGSRLAELLKTTSLYTNTMHHQCVKEPGRGLRITARTNDGIPEAMESEDGNILLVQWHPEELLTTEPRMLALFGSLVERAGKLKKS
jgi:putative glutamine amidotransferase